MIHEVFGGLTAPPLDRRRSRRQPDDETFGHPRDHILNWGTTMRSVLSLAVVPLLIPLQSITAQQAPHVETGSRIRVTAPPLGADKLAGV